MKRIGWILTTAALLATSLAVADGPAQTDRGKLVGRWTLKSYLFNGKPPAPERAPAELMEIRSDGSFQETKAGKVVTRGTFTIDDSKSPRHITAKFIEGGPEGETVMGIYEITGDRLRVCVGTPEIDRPTKFESTPGSRLRLIEYDRAK
jgi:uncharacterized protein (TIGR03067 family)